MKRTTIGSVLLATILVVGMTAPAMAFTSSAGSGSAPAAAMTTQNNSTVDVEVGQQLSTVIDASSDDVQTDFESTAFELEIEGDSEEEKAEAIADRLEELNDRIEDIRDDYEDATEEYEDGDMTTSEYAQRLATLNARASNVLDSYDQLQGYAANVSAVELEDAGVNETALMTGVEDLDSVSGSGAAALLKQFTGEERGEVRLDVENGLSIEVENEHGEQSREFERPRDDDDSITIEESQALETAQEALTTPDSGTWTLVETEQDDGAYEFEFVLENGIDLEGETEISVDGSSGKIFDLDEEIEVPSADDDDEDEEEDESEDETEDEEAEDDDSDSEDDSDDTEDDSSTETEDDSEDDGY